MIPNTAADALCRAAVAARCKVPLRKLPFPQKQAARRVVGSYQRMSSACSSGYAILVPVNRALMIRRRAHSITLEPSGRPCTPHGLPASCRCPALHAQDPAFPFSTPAQLQHQTARRRPDPRPPPTKPLVANRTPTLLVFGGQTLCLRSKPFAHRSLSRPDFHL